MSFNVENGDQHVIVKNTSEKLHSLNAPELKSQLVVLIKGGTRNIVVDLSETRYCDSSGLSALLTGNRLCDEAGGSFVICSLQPAVKSLITISQLNSVLNIVPTTDEAVDMIMMEEIERDLNSEATED
jgi:anti-anti-sigma factor